MDRIRSGIRLLALFSFFFIYKAIMGVIENSTNDATFWFLLTVVYIVSLTISYFVITRWEKAKTI